MTCYLQQNYLEHCDQYTSSIFPYNEKNAYTYQSVANYSFLNDVYSRYGFETIPIMSGRLKQYVAHFYTTNEYGQNLKHHLSKIMSIMRFSQVLGNSDMSDEMFDSLFGNMSYLELPLLEKGKSSDLDDYLVVPQNPKPRHARDRTRLEMIKHCTSPFSNDCTKDFNHLFSYGGICNVMNGVPFEDMLKSSWYTGMMNKIYNMQTTDDQKMNIGHGVLSQTRILLDTHGMEITASTDAAFMVDISSMYNAFDIGRSGLKIYPGTKTTITIVMSSLVLEVKILFLHIYR